MSKKTVSLKDLAQELNVSVSTVSRALKNNPEIGKDMTRKIQQLAVKRNYVSANFAFHPQAKTKSIGVIVPNMERNFYASIIAGIENYAKQEGYFIIIANSRESYVNELECVNNLLRLNVDGLIVCLTQETADYSHFDVALQKNIPLVFFDRICRTNEFSSVIADNTDAAFAITQHLIDNGAKHIAHLAGPKKLNITKERIAGYFRALEENNIPNNPDHLEYCNLTVNSALTGLRKLLKSEPRPDAIFCVNDTVAYVVIKEIKNQGLRIPEDITVTGFNNEFHSTFVEPTLTTIAHPTSEMGEETARMLIKQMASDQPHSPRQIVMKTNLVVRESSIKKQNINQKI